MSLSVLYEDNHIIAINKKAGDLVQGDETGDVPLSELVKQYIKQKYNKPGDVFLGVIHRLDRPVSGVVLFARTSKALARMNELFKQKAIQKTYWAVVKKLPQKTSDTLIHYHIKDKEKRMAKLFDTEKPNTKVVELSYQLIANSNDYYLLEVLPKTGRFHQIRAQLSKIGSPIKGDLKYRFDRSNADASIHLHARKVEFMHPVKKEKIIIEASVPKEDALWQFFEATVK